MRLRRIGERYEIKGISRKVIEKFSSRTKEIEALAKKLGVTNSKTKAQLGAKSRVSKSKVKEDAQLLEIWKKRLTQNEWLSLKRSKGKPRPNKNLLRAENTIQKALQHHMERKSVVAVNRILATAMSYGYGNFGLEDIKAAYKKNKDIVEAKFGYLKHCTTRQMIKCENRMIEFAARTKGTQASINPEYKIKRSFLNDDQKSAIKSILTTNDRVAILSGGAGTGKSSLLQEVREAALEKNKTVFGFAPSAQASRGALREKGFANANTLAMFLKSKEVQTKVKNQIVLIDEAGMVGVKDMQRTFEIARAQNARVILSGDVRQHQSPSSGDALKILIEKAELPVIKVDQIVRQPKNSDYKKAVKQLADGKTRAGFEVLDKQGAVKEVPDQKERHLALAEGYINSVQSNRSALVISPTHHEGRIITETMRSELKTRGRIKKDTRQFTILESLTLTTAQKQDVANYETGLVLKPHQNIKGGYKAGERFRCI